MSTTTATTGATTATTTPLPDWVREIRDHQVHAVQEVVEEFQAGAGVVFLDAPTGAGKTLIGELVRREMAGAGMGARRVLYVCSDKQLQDQFVRDFPYAKVLKGRGNYRTELGGASVTCEDCTSTGQESGCLWCESSSSCPYKVAKAEALKSELAVVNTSYLLSEANHVGKFSGFDLVIVDEADTLESILMGFVEYRVPRYAWKELGLKGPVKGARKPTIVKWLAGVEADTKNHIERNSGHWEPKVKNRWRGFATDTARVREELVKDIAASESDDESSGKWLRDYDNDTFCMKPVMVAGYGPRYLWRHGKKFLLMSATVVSAAEMVESLGVPHEYAVVTVPMTFPVENRPIVAAPVADVTYRNQEVAVADLAYAVVEVCRKHAGEKVLVHTVSYTLNRKLVDAVSGELRRIGRTVWTYQSAKEREGALAGYMASDRGVLLAPSMERGVDLKGDACRVVVVAKVPFPALGDKRIGARVRLPGGSEWYAVQTIRDLVQMTGRGVRNADDWAVSYVLDRQFVTNVWKNHLLIPKWWREAVDMKRDNRWLMRPR